MRVENRFNALAVDPVRRVVRVHAESLANAMRHRPCKDVAPTSCETDEGQCRIIVNALRREIDRLMRGIDRYDLCAPLQRRDQSPEGPKGDGKHASPAALEFAKLASAVPNRKVYAAAPLGAVNPPAALGASAAQSASASSPAASSTTAPDATVVDLLA